MDFSSPPIYDIYEDNAPREEEFYDGMKFMSNKVVAGIEVIVLVCRTLCSVPLHKTVAFKDLFFHYTKANIHDLLKTNMLNFTRSSMLPRRMLVQTSTHTAIWNFCKLTTTEEGSAVATPLFFLRIWEIVVWSLVFQNAIHACCFVMKFLVNFSKMGRMMYPRTTWAQGPHH